MDFSGIIGLLENLNWNLLMVDRLLLIFKMFAILMLLQQTFQFKLCNAFVN